MDSFGEDMRMARVLQAEFDKENAEITRQRLFALRLQDAGSENEEEDHESLEPYASTIADTPPPKPRVSQKFGSKFYKHFGTSKNAAKGSTSIANFASQSDISLIPPSLTTNPATALELRVVHLQQQIKVAIEEQDPQLQQFQQHLEWDLLELMRWNEEGDAGNRVKGKEHKKPRLDEKEEGRGNAELKDLESLGDQLRTDILKLRKEGYRKAKQGALKQLKEDKRKLRQVDCTACMDTGDMKDMALLSCGHAYCGGCITQAFQAASASRVLFRCCELIVPVPRSSRWLSRSFIANYKTLMQELSTPNPHYCAFPCSKFIPPQHVHGKTACCQACHRRTCLDCGNEEHAGICDEDVDGKAVQVLAEREGWKQCPKCRRICEKISGCLHVTCRCRAQWCYNCVRDWSVCNSTCMR